MLSEVEISGSSASLRAFLKIKDVYGLDSQVVPAAAD